ncbi:MAG: ACP S-malonyltransferase [Alphaproteobacteria bacterium]|nr:ACP S-malonyltransferase [Alphaproteobacteria bacterium]
MSRALTFPGQGSQAVGMGQALAQAFETARELFQEVDEALKQPLSRVMWQGPDADLTLTENAQPALMAVSLAVMRVLEVDGGFQWGKHTSHVAGHSLGEYSALAAAGAFSVADAARLLKARGLAMQRAVPVGIGGMAALLGAELSQAEDVSQEASQGCEICCVANDNAPGQVVISGHKAALERAAEIAKTKGIKRTIMLPVSAPFHSPMMAPAAREMEDAFDRVSIRPPRVPVISNVSVKPESDPAVIRRLLVEQITARVRWRETVESFKALGITSIAEIGAGKVLMTMAKRIDKDLPGVSIESPQDIEAFLKSI